MSSSDDRQLIQEIEDHAATVNRYLDALKVALKNAKRAHDSEQVRHLHNEIAYYTGVLTELKARRAEIARRVKRTEA